MHFLFFNINALSCIGSLFILSSSFFNAFSCILSFFFHMLFLYPISFSFDLSHICFRIQLYFSSFYLPTTCFHSSIRSLITFVFLCIIQKRTTFNVPLTLLYCTLYTYILYSFFLFVHPIFSFILYSFRFCFLCILLVFIRYCIFFNLRFIMLSFFVLLQIILSKFSVHIYCFPLVFVFLHYISSMSSLSPVLYSFLLYLT